MSTKKKSTDKHFTVECTNPDLLTAFKNYFPKVIQADTAEEAIQKAVTMTMDGSRDITLLFTFIPKIKESFTAQLKAADNTETINSLFEEAEALENKLKEALKTLDTTNIENINEKAYAIYEKVKLLYRKDEISNTDYAKFNTIFDKISAITYALRRLS